MRVDRLPPSWSAALASELRSPWFSELCSFVDDERARHAVYPAHDDVFAAFEATPLDAVEIVLVGQDPYHGPGQAHGLAFSVPPGVTTPPSLANILREVESDAGVARPANGCLRAWAERGVLLLNTSLTVRAGEAGSHQKRGWERLTDAAVRAVSARERGAVFLLWGAAAQKKAALVDSSRHRVIVGVHPSPLSAHRGFFGSRPFSRANEALRALGRPPIDWSLAR